MTHYTSDDELRAIADKLVARTLPHADWTHAAHWAAAFWLLTTRDAYTDMPGIIRAYNTSVGTPNSDTEGYHETITVASLRAAEAAIKAAPDGEALHETLNRLLAGPYGKIRLGLRLLVKGNAVHTACAARLGCSGQGSAYLGVRLGDRVAQTGDGGHHQHDQCSERANRPAKPQAGRPAHAQRVQDTEEEEPAAKAMDQHDRR